jgi:cobalamin biosynthesis protein CbiG
MAKTVIIGVGLTEEALIADAVKLVEAVLSGPLVDARPAAIATIFGRAEHPVVQGIAGYLSVPVLVFDAARLERETPRLLNPSEALYHRIGCHGVAEAAALAAGGAGAVLLVGKTKAGGVTVAVASTAAAS